jgi:hypothetical protein
LCIYTIVISYSLLTISCKNDSNINQYNDIVNEYLIPNQINILTSAEPETLQKGLEEYNQGNYKLASEILTDYEPILQPLSRLAYAISLLKTDQEKKATAQFKKLEPIPLFNDASYWYQGLMLLSKGDVGNMKAQFDKIKEGSRYKPKTLEIISKTK